MFRTECVSDYPKGNWDVFSFVHLVDLKPVSFFSSPDLYCASSSHLYCRAKGRSTQRPAQQHAYLWHVLPFAHGNSCLCRGQICQQTGPGLPGLRDSLHHFHLRRSHQVQF